jgi:cytochrome P450
MSNAFPTLPGPRPILALDPALAQLRLARNPLGRMTELFARFGAPVALVRGGGGRVFSGDPACPGVVFVRGAELTREVALQHDRFHRSALTGQLTPPKNAPERLSPILVWGTGLFAVNGEEHRRHRRLMSPFFTRSRVESYLGQMQQAADEMITRWRPGRTLDMHRELMDLTVRISARTLLGLDMDSHQPIVRAGAESLRLVLSPWALLLPFYVPGLPYWRLVESLRSFNSQMRSLIEQRRSAGAGLPDVLTQLVQASDEEGSLSDAEVVGHASVVYAASHETTGNALTWALFLLSQHPTWHRAASTEVRSTLRADVPTLAELDELPLLDNVIRETLRIAPAAPWTTRIAAEDGLLGGHFIPRGTEIVVSIFHTHRDEAVYERPDTFDPARWETIRPDVFQFNAFSAGTRACIGSGFALLEMKTVLAMILKRYRLEFNPCRPVEPVLNITMAPKFGLRMVVRDDTCFENGAGTAVGRIRDLVSLN